MTRPAAGLRVLMIAPTPFFSDRGCHVRILEEARALMRAGAEVTICTYFLGDDVSGVDVRRGARLPGYGKRAAGPAWGKLVLDAGLVGLARRTARAMQPHVIHAHLHEGIGIARAVRAVGPAGRRVPCVLDVQGGLADETLDHGFVPDVRPVRRMLEGVEGWLDRSADVVVTSHAGAARAVTARFRVPAERVRAVGDAGTLGPPDPARTRAARERWGLGPDQPVFLYAGVLGEHQGTQHLFALGEALRDAAARGKTARDSTQPGCVLILGYPEERWRAEAARRGLNQHMIFAGRFAYPDFASLLALGTVALSPKISATEGNQKLYAYLEAGLPVVAFDTPVTREILGEAGVLVPSGDDAAFAREALALAGDPEHRTALAAQAHARAAALGTWDDVAAKLLDAYRAAGATW
jgi:glycosyltransferase involved in cell wall biosynthesis